MMKPYNLLIGALAMFFTAQVQAGDVVITTQKAVGETFTLAADAGINLQLTWGNGAVEPLACDGLPATFTIKDAQLTLSSESDITKLYMPGNGITALNVDGIKGTLKKLYCPSNNLTTLDLYGCQKLTDVDVQDNQLESMRLFYYLEDLNSFNCAGNKLEKLELFQIPRMAMLVLADNQFTEVPCANLLPQLRSLFAQNNHLANLNLRISTKACNVLASNNKLTTVNLQPMVALQELWVGDNSLSTLDLSNAHQLVRLEAPANKLSEIKWDLSGGNYASLASFNVADNGLYFNSFPTINDEDQPIQAKLTPQEPFLFVEQAATGAAITISPFQSNGWGKGIKPTFAFFKEDGSEMEKGTDYKLVRTLTFQTEQHRAYAVVTAPEAYPGVELTSKKFKITGPDAIGSLRADAEAGTIHTLSGLRVQRKGLQRGVYVVNGKKVVIQ